MNKIFGILFFLLFLVGCDRQEPTPLWVVEYRVIKATHDPISYRVTYRLQNGSTKLVGPISADTWESEELPEFKEGDLVSLEIEVISGSAELVVEILRGGAMRLTDKKSLSAPDFYIETNL